ncbi:IS3 family transposase [Aldersonia sp. NBC_00410]|nr:IS3 family transposase [Aldersonia sp. NBC_00410]MCX5044616.1 IS3 family transposase [Aldersonia sp. NBC_00410]
MGRSGYPPEFRRRVLDLVEAGRKVADVARDLGISDQTIYIWRRQERIERGLEPGLSSPEKAELAAAKQRIAQLEAELAVHRRATELMKEAVRPKDRFAAIAAMAEQGLSIQIACRVLGVSESGFYDWRSRPPSARSIRHAWLTDQIRAVHAASRGAYGARRVHAELRLGRGILFGHNAVELLMRRAGITGAIGRPKWRHAKPDQIATDLINRDFTAERPNCKWLNDITERHTREGKVYCAVVLDVYSRRVVGWSIDSSPTAALVTNALGMAIDNREPTGGTIIHSGQGSQYGSWAFTKRAKNSGLVPSMGSVGDCYDNAMMESFWSRMQVELLDRHRWQTRIEPANAIFDYIEIFHNRQRRHPRSLCSRRASRATGCRGAAPTRPGRPDRPVHPLPAVQRSSRGYRQGRDRASARATDPPALQRLPSLSRMRPAVLARLAPAALGRSGRDDPGRTRHGCRADRHGFGGHRGRLTAAWLSPGERSVAQPCGVALLHAVEVERTLAEQAETDRDGQQARDNYEDGHGDHRSFAGVVQPLGPRAPRCAIDGHAQGMAVARR